MVLTSLYYKKFLTFIYFVLINKVEISLHSLQLIKMRLSQDLLLLLLQPKWLVKLERSFFIQKQKQYILIISQHISKILIKSKQYKTISKITIDTFLDLKNIQLKKWLNKIDHNSSIIKWLFNYLMKQKYIKNNFIAIDNLFYLTNKNELSELFKAIYFTGLEWFFYTNKIDKAMYINLYVTYQRHNLVIATNKYLINRSIKCIGYFIKWQFFNLKKIYCNVYQYSIPFLNINTITIKKTQSTECLIKPSKLFVNFLVSSIRSKIYCQNQYGYWKIQTNVSLHRMITFIKFLLQYWYRYYFSIIDTLDILNLNKRVDNILYLWQTKK